MSTKQTTATDKPMTDKDEKDYLAMMDALEVFFHMAICPNHTDEERKGAFRMAQQAFVEFYYDGENPDPAAEVVSVADARPPEHVLGDDDRQNAPTSRKVH